jgi:hypothetical protein
MKLRNIGTEQLIVNNEIVHPNAECECDHDPGIDGLVPVNRIHQPQTGTRVPVSEEPGRKVGAGRFEPPKERETDPEIPGEDDFGGGA